MKRSALLTLTSCVVVTLTGCATAPPPAPERDAVGEIIAKYAESATHSLRTLSEVEGGTRVTQLAPTVTAVPARPVLPAYIGANSAPITREGAPAAPVPAAAPAQAVIQPGVAPSNLGPYQVIYQPIFSSSPGQSQAPAQASPPAAAHTQYAQATPAATSTPVASSAGSVTVSAAAASASVQPMVRSADRIVYGAGGVTGGGNALTLIPSGLERRITLADVTDDVEGLVEKISKQIGWTRLPSTGIRVSRQPLTVNAVDRPAIEVIRDLSGAVGRNAEIVVTPGIRTLMVQFPIQ